MKKLRKNGKAIALLAGIVAILFLAAYGLVTIIKDISTKQPDNSEVPSGVIINTEKPKETVAPSLKPAPTATPIPENKEITVGFSSGSLIVNNHRGNLQFTNTTGSNTLTVYISDSNCSQTGYFEISGFDMADGYSISDERDGILITINVNSEFNLRERIESEKASITIIPQLNTKYIEYRNDLSRTYLNIQKARLCSESDSFIKNYTEIYDESSKTFTITIPINKMPNLKDEILLLNDGIIKSIEFKKRSSDIQIIVKVYEKIVIYPNTRDYDAAFTFIEPKPDGGPLIVIDSGHGGIDGGTTNADESILEKNIVVKMGIMLADILESEGFNVLNLREEDIFLGLMERTDIANLANADAIISVHINSYTAEYVNGATTIYKTSDKLATSIQESIVAVTGANSMGIVKMMDMSILNRAEMDAVIVETGFLTNEAEAELLNTEDYQKKVAEGIANGIIEYFNGK